MCNVYAELYLTNYYNYNIKNILYHIGFFTVLFICLHYQSRWTPLHVAAYHNKVQVVRILIHANADLDIPDSVMIKYFSY